MNPPTNPPQKPPKAPIEAPKTTPKFGIKKGVTRNGWKIGIYGPEGIGKSSLAALCPGAIFADIESSMDDLDVQKVEGISKWEDLRAWVQQLENCIAGIDSMTRAEDWAAQYIIANKKANDGMKASDSIEDFKYKAGLQFVVDEFRRFLADIDNARRRNVSFIMVAHNRITKTKNPDGSDFVRHEPRLIDDPKASNMLQWVQFLDHLVMIDLDKNVEKGKASGCGSRTIYLDTAPSRICKARGIPNDPIVFPNPKTNPEGACQLWKLLGL
jgi:ABC-type cobalamin transport system ATPase subunit